MINLELKYDTVNCDKIFVGIWSMSTFHIFYVHFHIICETLVCRPLIRVCVNNLFLN